MKDRVNLTPYIVFGILLVILLWEDGVFSSCWAESENLLRHPVYSGYDFGKNESVIDFATQPLAAPLGVIVEVMKRDNILADQLKRRGKKLRFHSFLKGADANFFIKTGLVETTMTGDTPAISLAVAYDTVIAALVKQGHTSLIAKKQMQISGLKGKRIGYSFGSTAHYGLLIGLYAAGMSETDVVMVPMEINKLAETLEKGDLDAIAAWEPIPMALLAAHPEYAVLQQFMNTNYYCFTRVFVTRHPEETALLLASFLRALRWMKAKPENLLMAAGWNFAERELFQHKPSEVTVEQLAEITRSQALPLAEAPYIPLRDFDESGMFSKSLNFLKSQKLIPASASWDKLRSSIDRDLLAAVVSNQVVYELDTFDYGPGNHLK